MNEQVDRGNYTTKNTSECRNNVIRFLANIGGSASYSSIAAIFTLTYRFERGHHRRHTERISAFLRSMEDDGMIACQYDDFGTVTRIALDRKQLEEVG